MEVKILEMSTMTMTEASIRPGEVAEMPSIQENWTFNFNKHIKLPNATAYVLVTKDKPGQIEGCLIFQMKNKEVPYMAYVEVAPHNRSPERKYDLVAGCLIAFAFRQSLVRGRNDYKGMLVFDVIEQAEDKQKRLMSLYSNKYYAKHIPNTKGTMIISDEDGEKLINEYL